MSKLQNYFKSQKKPTVTTNSKNLTLVMNQLTMDSNEVESISGDLQELNDIEGGLLTIASSMENVLEEGSLNQTVVLFAQHAVEGYVGRLGVDSTKVIHSLESFNNDSEETIVASLEGIGAVLADIWKAIKKATLAVYGAIRKFFSSLFGSTTETLSKKSDEVKNELNEVSEELYSKVKDLKLPLKAPNILKFNGKVDEKSILNGIKNSLIITSELRQEFIERNVNDIDKINKYVENVKNRNSMAVVGDLRAVESNIVELMELFSGHSSTVISGDLYLDYSKGGNIIDSVPVLIPVSKTKTLKSGISTNVFSPDSLTAMNKHCNDILLHITDSEQEVKAILDNYDLVLKNIDEIYSEGKKNEKMAIVLRDPKTKYLLKNIRTPITRILTKLDGHLAKVVKEGLDLVSANLDIYKVAES